MQGLLEGKKEAGSCWWRCEVFASAAGGGWRGGGLEMFAS